MTDKILKPDFQATPEMVKRSNRDRGVKYLWNGIAHPDGRKYSAVILFEDVSWDDEAQEESFELKFFLEGKNVLSGNEDASVWIDGIPSVVAEAAQEIARFMAGDIPTKAELAEEKKRQLKKAASEYFEARKQFYWSLDDDMGTDVRYKFRRDLETDIGRARAVLKVAKRAARLVELYELLTSNGWDPHPDTDLDPDR